MNPAIADLVKLCAHGGYFCNRCQRFRDMADADGYKKCAVCGSHRVKWCPPVEGFKAQEELDALKSNPERCHV